MISKLTFFRSATLATTCASLLCACSSTPVSNKVDSELLTLAPYAYDADESNDALNAPSSWLETFTDPELVKRVHLAIDQNFSLEEARYRVEAAWQQRRATRGGLLPQFDLDLGAQRSGGGNSDNSLSDSNTSNEQFDISAGLSWEIDLWGQQRDSLKADDYLWQAEKASYMASRISLAGQVAKAWYQWVTENQLLQLFEQRVGNLETNLDIIQDGYRRGIDSALDVYLARSDLASERSNLNAQRQLEVEAARELQLLMGRYPTGKLEGLSPSTQLLPELPVLGSEQSLSSDLVRSRYDLQTSFLTLAAADRDLAAAHKARFPSFSISASYGRDSDDFSDLFDGSDFAWNLLGNLTQPIFRGGQLQAQEKQQEAELRQAEQQYLDALYTAFSEVENGLTNETYLREQLKHLLNSKADAEAAEELAFDEYRQGLQTYAYVLEAQRSAFTAQNSVLSLRNELLQNRINLYLALGGDF